MVITNPVIKLKKELPIPLKVLTSPKTTAVLAGTLGVLLAPAAAGRLAVGAGKAALGFVKKSPVKALVGVPSAAGLLAASPKVRSLINPKQSFQRGKEAGKLIEQGVPKGLTTSDALKKAGLVGAGVAGAAGAVAAGKKVIEKVRGATKEKAIAASPSVAPALPSNIPVGVAKQTTASEEPAAAKVPPATPPINVKNKVEVNVNVKQSRSKKFINQKNVFRK